MEKYFSESRLPMRSLSAAPAACAGALAPSSAAAPQTASARSRAGQLYRVFPVPLDVAPKREKISRRSRESKADPSGDACAFVFKTVTTSTPFLLLQDLAEGHRDMTLVNARTRDRKIATSIWCADKKNTEVTESSWAISAPCPS
jgi:hypothetical protein